ncbi:hypothetical protein Aduo_017715 [Ancylostoma duodenale]
MNEVIHHPNVEDIVRLPGTGGCKPRLEFEITGLLFSECKNFVYCEAIEQHRGVRADELSFDAGDLVLVSVS